MAQNQGNCSCSPSNSSGKPRKVALITGITGQ
ncbi:hypothetical protein XELAEV_180315662mg, partial [Xenopus laevis]